MIIRGRRTPSEKEVQFQIDHTGVERKHDDRMKMKTLDEHPTEVRHGCVVLHVVKA